MNNKFKEKQFMAELLNELYEQIEEKEKYIGSTYKPVGEKQDRDWKTLEYLWEDEEKTIPKMVPDYGYVAKNEEDLTEEDKLKIKVCQQIKAQLEKMI